MKKLQGENFQTVLKLPEEIKIEVNLLNWILFIPPRNYWYYSTLPELITDLFDYKIKHHAINNEEKDIKSFRNSIEKSNEEINTILQQLTTITDGRLDSFRDAWKRSKPKR